MTRNLVLSLPQDPHVYRHQVLAFSGGLLGQLQDYCQYVWWAMLGLNQRPLPCEGSALPLS